MKLQPGGTDPVGPLLAERYMQRHCVGLCACDAIVQTRLLPTGVIVATIDKAGRLHRIA